MGFSRSLFRTSRKAIKRLGMPVFVWSERLFHYPYMKKAFREKMGYELDLNNPQSFSQKVCWKKAYDRNPLLPIVADKYKVREYVREALGTEEAEKILVPLYYVTDRPETIPFDELPDEYVIKPNHGSGQIILVEKGSQLQREQVVSRCRRWLKQPYGVYKHEWAYQHIQRKILVEKLLKDQTGTLAKDYKFHMIHGKCEQAFVIKDRFADIKKMRYSGNWEPFGEECGMWDDSAVVESDFEAKPIHFDEMMRIAETLSKPFDYIRVDFYVVDHQVYLSELTNYPASGMKPFKQRGYDFELGSKWKITPNYWIKD